MKQYLLSLYQPVGVVPDAEFLAPVMENLGAINRDLGTAGSWVFSGGLHQPETATVIRPNEAGTDPLITDGPYLEGKEFVGGFWVIQTEDLDAALGWGRRITDVTGLPVEVMPFQFASLAPA
jgi:hypothetical protein